MPVKVELRNVRAEDLPIFYQQQLDPDATQMAEFPSRDWEPFQAHWEKNLANDENIMMTILYEDQVAGNIVSYIQSGEREVGYWLGKAFWGKGIAPQALTILLDLVKDRPLYAHVAKQNLASRRVLEKCGFCLISEDIWTNPKTGKASEELILVLN